MAPYVTPLMLTLKVAFCATLFSSALGIVIARWMQCNQRWGSNWIDALLTLPMVLPPTVLGYYLIVIMGRRGVLGAWLQHHLGVSLMFTWQGAVLAAAVAALPLVLKSARAAFESVDEQFEQAARTLGASEWSIFLRISLPLAWRGILAGSTTNIQDLTDLVDAPQLRISIGDPETVPAGRYARLALQRLDLWDKLRNRLILATSVKQVLDYLRRDEIDAGLVYNTDVRIAGEAVHPIKTVATDDPIVYCIAITAASSRQASGQQFIDYLLNDTGNAVLATFGFERP